MITELVIGAWLDFRIALDQYLLCSLHFSLFLNRIVYSDYLMPVHCCILGGLGRYEGRKCDSFFYSESNGIQGAIPKGSYE